MEEVKKPVQPPRSGPYTAKDKAWTDAGGTSIPYGRVTALEKLKEKNAWRLLATAQAIEKQLVAFKPFFLEMHNAVVEAFEKGEGTKLKKGKGNMEWWDMSRTIRIEANVQEKLEFDGLTITAARECLDKFLEQNLDGKEEAMLVDMVKGAFATTKGQLDPKRVTGLLSYRHRTKARLFHDACDLIEKSITRTYSKTYLRVSLRNESGEMVPVQLNWSSLL